MRQKFLLGVVVACVILGLAYLVWIGIRSIWIWISEHRAHRELDEMEAAFVQRRRDRAEALRQRLNNGCEHQFDSQFGTFPDGVCCRCGLSREVPAGPCDHIWQRVAGPVPGSRCEKCGRMHGGMQE
ncbi:MAG: hypothetical protein R3E01_30435 [Pirellulaceae bacterium]|nr:hypothetical protein [Planctomycetales bacterium]